jgi:translation initiation factor 2B subunit (eIF-2B alpha/beta/delta family)
MPHDPRLDDALRERLAAFAGDRLSGALHLTGEALVILRMARGSEALPRVARALCDAQPAMASVWNAAISALAGEELLSRFERRVERAPAALARMARAALSGMDDPHAAPGVFRVVTYSGSGSVFRVLESLAASHPIHVSVGEGRPHLEGRVLAERLAGAGIPVDCYLDAGLGPALDEASAVLVGADAIGPAAFINKSGTRLVLAAAAQAQVPAYVVATRDKLAAPALWSLLRLPEHSPDELWPDPPSGVTVRNRHFEATPCSLATAFVTDLGVLHPSMLPAACEGQLTADLLRALGWLRSTPAESHRTEHP